MIKSVTPEKPRVLHCVSHLSLGGAERVAVSLIDALKEDFSFSVYAVRGVVDPAIGRALQQELSASGIPLYCGLNVPMRLGGLITGAAGLRRAVHRAQPDLLHLHTEIPEASCAAMLALRPRLNSIPLVRTIHNSVFWEFWRPLGLWCDRKLAHAQIAGVSRGAIEAFDRLRRHSTAPPPPESPQLIYNGVRIANAPPRTARSPDDPIRIVFGGRLESEKGADLLPEILAQTPPPLGRRAHLTIYGHGRHALLLHSLAHNPPARWTVEVCEPIADFVSRLNTFDLVLIPSRHEGLPLVALEAAHLGLPILATDAPGLCEAVPPDHPWLAQAGNPAAMAAVLRQALDTPSAWPKIAAEAQAFARERFALKPMADAYRGLYRRALPKSRRPRTALPD